MRLDLLAHIVILVFKFKTCSALAVFRIYEVYAVLDYCLALFILRETVVTDDVGKFRLLHTSAEIDDVEKPFIAAREFRPFAHREQPVEFHSNQNRILHLALRVSRMDVAPLNPYGRGSGIEILIFQFSNRSTVHSVGILRSETSDVEFHHSTPDFLVRSEANADFSVFELRMLHDILHRIHNLGDSRLVVGAKKCRSVCCDDCLTFIISEFREIRNFQLQARHSPKRNIPAVISFDNLRFYVRARSIGRCVHVGDKPD